MALGHKSRRIGHYRSRLLWCKLGYCSKATASGKNRKVSVKIGNFCPKETLDSSNKGVKERKGERAKEHGAVDRARQFISFSRLLPVPILRCRRCRRRRPAACVDRKKGEERKVQWRVRALAPSSSLSHFSRLPYWFRHIIFPSPSSRRIGAGTK